MANENRISARVDDNTYKTLKKATLLSGLTSVSSFIVNSSVEQAKKIILHERLSNLSDEQINKLMEVVQDMH